uniref:Cytochrome P450 monooxygenase n=1 Tax=Trametes versicolor TaxID=5325 RepID=A0AA86M9N9_TRAVE|nr:cytochrome P450 monooxygenase [Trametes versicolor]
MDASRDTLLHAVAAVSGLAAWIYLHGRTVRGDHALSFYTLCAGTLYVLLQRSPGLQESPLRTTTVFTSIHALCLSVATVIYRLSPWHPLASHPGPFLARISSLWLAYVSSTGRRHRVMDRLHAKHGPFVRIGPNALSINSLSALSLYAHLEKGESYRFPVHDRVASIFLKQDSKEGHRERRRIWGGLFTPSSISAMTPALERRTWQLMQCIEQRQSVGGGLIDLPEAFYHWSCDLGGDVVFGGCNELELMRNGDVNNLVATGKYSTAMMDTFGHSPWLLHVLWRIPATKDMHKLVTMTAEMARKRVGSKEPPTSRDLLSYLIDGGVPMADMERDGMIAILAASENTTITLALACYFLAADPQYLHQLRNMLEQAFPDPLGPLSQSALAALPLIDGVVNEALRLGSHFFLPRVTPKGGVEVDGVHIPGDTIVALASYSIQTSPDHFYPEPMNFRPERWLPEGLGPDTKTDRTALAAFSYGQHACLGKTLAYNQMRYVLARLVLAYDMSLKPGFDVQAFREGIVGRGVPNLEVPLEMTFQWRPGVHFDDLGDRA